MWRSERARRAARPRRLRPIVEVLESRETPAAGALGISVIPEFVDVAKQALVWEAAPGSTTFNRDSEGWPTTDAQVLLMDLRVNMPWNGPDPLAVAPDVGGEYAVSFRGSATVGPPIWNQNLTILDQSYNPTTNTTTARMVIPRNAYPLVYLVFSNTRNPLSATGAGITDLKVYRPGYALDSPQVFTRQLISALGPFGVLRTLNAADVNAYPIEVNGALNSLDWSERRLPSESSQYDNANGKIGVAWEHLIRLANESDSDLWINIPGPATDDYVLRLAQLVARGDVVDGVFYEPLEAGRKVYLEYSNEVWGGIWNNRLYNIAAAQAEVAAGTTAVNNDGINDPAAWGERRYLERTRAITQIFRSVLGSDPNYDRVRPVLGWQDADWSSGHWQYYRRNLDWFERTFGPARQTFYGAGVANYWGPENYATVDAIMDSLRRREADNITSATRMTTIATYYGLKNVAYEGGPALVGDGATSDGRNALAALRDPRMADLVYQHYVNWYASGGSLASFFDGPYGIWGPWFPWAAAEQSQAANPSQSPKYRGLTQLDAAAPVAVQAGYRVDPQFFTSFPATVDAFGRSFQNPATGADAYFLLNVRSGGTFAVSLSTAGLPSLTGRRIGIGGGTPSSGPATGIVQVYLNDEPQGRPVELRANALNLLTNLAPRPGLNTIRLVVLRGANDPSAPTDPNRYAFRPMEIRLDPVVLREDSGTSVAASTTGPAIVTFSDTSTDMSRARAIVAGPARGRWARGGRASAMAALPRVGRGE